MGLRKTGFVRLWLPVFCVLVLSACGGAAANAPTATPARELSAPTLAPSPTVDIRPSGELYEESDVNPGQLDPTAASLPSSYSLPPLIVGTPNEGGHHTVQILLEDGTQVTGDLYQRGISRVPGMLIVAPDKEAWGLLPVRLYSAGMTVLVIESRENPQPMDMDNLLVSLSEIGTVDPGQIAVMGADSTAEMVLTGCAASGLCDAVVLLSPSNREVLLQAMQTYAPRPVLVAAAEDDAAGYSAAVALASAASGTSQLLSYPTGKGTALLELQPDLIDSIVTWLVGQFPLIVPDGKFTTVIEVYWKDSGETIVQLDYYAPVVSWAEYHQAIDRSVQMAKVKDYTVHFLHHPGNTPMPRGNPLMELRRAYRKLPPNIGRVVMVVNNTLAIHIIDLAIKILGMRRAHLVATLEEAQRYLKERQFSD